MIYSYSRAKFMDLKTYFLTNRQSDFAKALGVTPGAVNQWVSGATAVAVERCIEIEKATGGQVRCEDLRPDVDWAYIRGTSFDRKQPPALDGQAVGAMAEGTANV